MKQILFTLLFVTLSFSGHAAQYEVDYNASVIGFSGTHAGNEFEGIFESWTADITFDPNDLENSKVTAVFDLSTAKTGSKLYDGTLPQDDWFDVKNHPEGTFTSTKFEAGQDGSYMAHGDLTLRGVTHPISFAFTLSDLKMAPVTLQASFPIDRFVYDIGKKSDPSAEWVSQEITMTLTIVANKI